MEALLESQEMIFEAPDTISGRESFGNRIPDFGDYMP
jgi:hypothetical protein